MKKIGVLYLEPEHFLDEANKTIGLPLVGPDLPQIFRNRRQVTNRLNDAGKRMKSEAVHYFKKTFNIDVILRWSIHAGCSMCPCSPGFVILTDNQNTRYYGRLKDNQEINIWVKAGRLDVRLPENEYRMPIVDRSPVLEPLGLS